MMGIRELARKLKAKTVQEWMEENDKRPYKWGNNWFDWAGYDVEDLNNPHYSLPNHIARNLPPDKDGDLFNIDQLMRYRTEQDAIIALEVALKKAGEI